MKKSYVVSIILAFAMLGVGLAFPLPDKNVHVSSYSYSNNAKWGGKGVEYVGVTHIIIRLKLLLRQAG